MILSPIIVSDFSMDVGYPILLGVCQSVVTLYDVWFATMVDSNHDRVFFGIKL
jgi:hypothetical protein